MHISEVEKYRAQKDEQMRNPAPSKDEQETHKMILDEYRNSDFIEGYGKYGSESEYAKLKKQYPNDEDLRREAIKEKGNRP